MEKDKNIYPYLDRILSEGIQTEDEIDPTLHNCTFKLNLEKRNEFMTVECSFSNGVVCYNNKRIGSVKWLSNGVMFEVNHHCYPLVEMVAAVLETIQELREIH